MKADFKVDRAYSSNNAKERMTVDRMTVFNTDQVNTMKQPMFLGSSPRHSEIRFLQTSSFR